MRLFIPLLCVVLLCQYSLAAPAGETEDDKNDQSTLDNVLSSIWRGVVALKDAAEPHVRQGYNRIKAAAVGEEGAGGARATLVTIINKTGKSFKLTKNHCNYGQFSDQTSPAEILEATSKIQYKSHSNRRGYGTGCEVKYVSSDMNDWFTLETENPYVGSNTMKADASHGLSLEQKLGNGFSNEVTLTVSPAF